MLQDSSSKSESTASSHSFSKSNSNYCGKSNSSAASKNKSSSSSLPNKKMSKTRSQPVLPSPAPSNQDKSKPKDPVIYTPKEDEVGYEFAMRGKSGKRGKGVPVADLSFDQCLELPYSPKTVKPPSASMDLRRSITKRKAVRVKSDSSCGSPPSATSAKVEKTVSTNAVAPNNAIVTPIPRPPAENTAIISQNSKDSYSSKVSNHEVSNSKQMAKVAPVGKILPEVNRVAPQRSLGVIGQKLVSNPSPGFTAPQAPQLSLFQSSADLVSYYPSPPPLSLHSWDPKTVGSGTVGAPPPAPSVIAPPPLPRDPWQYSNAAPKQPQANQPSAPGSIWNGGDLSEVIGSSNLSCHTPLPSSVGAPWDTFSSIWSSSNPWTSSSSLWAPTESTAVSQGLGFDPFKSVSWAPSPGGGDVPAPGGSTGGWPTDIQQGRDSSLPHNKKDV